jgi:pimeloyl-ACP methyl ester carboxylesterase
VIGLLAIELAWLSERLKSPIGVPMAFPLPARGNKTALRREVSNERPAPRRASSLPPKAELQWWYQYYFATERGRDGYDKYRYDFSKLIWQLASPKWDFDDATFNRTAAAFNNPDHVAIVIHNYRWRLGLAEGEPKYDDLEKRLAEGPVITVPTITLEGDANGAPHPDPSSYAKKFSGKYSFRLIKGGVGHNLPQEAPHAFAEAIVDVTEV